MAFISESLNMIKNPNITSRIADRFMPAIKDSLLGDALARNRISKPQRLLQPYLVNRPISKPVDEAKPREAQ